MSELTETRRTGWDLVLGALLVVVGFVLLAHAAFATVVSVVFVGWMILAAGLFTLTASLLRIGKQGFWTALLGGGTLSVLGIVFLRNTELAAVTLTLVAGAIFLSTGLARLVAAVQIPEARVPLVIGGGISTLLGLLVLFNLFDTSLVLLGVMLAVETIAEGVAIMVAGRGRERVTLGSHTSAPAV